MYKKFAQYYDRLGWSEFSLITFEKLRNFLRDSTIEVRDYLDVACGTGTMALLMAREGYNVTGIDISEDMIAIAKGKPGAKDVRFEVADMRDFDLKGKFDLITCFFDAINHLTTAEDWRKAFRTARNHLREGGAYIFDVNTMEGLKNWNFQMVEDRGDATIIRQGVFEEERGEARMRIEGFIRMDNGFYDRFAEVFVNKAFPIEEVVSFLKDSGFGEVLPLFTEKEGEELERFNRVFLLARSSHL
ncbi:MAG: class I SAM-dependent DNA methyltransferase [bacterium]